MTARPLALLPPLDVEDEEHRSFRERAELLVLAELVSWRRAS